MDLELDLVCDEPVGLPDLPVSLPPIEALPDLPALDALPEVDGLPELAPAIPAAGAETPDDPIPTVTGGSPVEPAADSPESQAGSARPGRWDQPAALAAPGGLVAWAPALAVAAPAAGLVAQPERALKRRPARDITRRDSVIPAADGPSGAATFFAAAAAPPAGGAAPAMLTTPILLVLSFLGGALIGAFGLPRMQPRADRLERPG